MIVKSLSNSFNPVPKSGQKNVKEPAKSGSKNVIKKKSSKLAKLEKNRFSIITKKVDVCYICKSNKKEDWHEVIEGKNRQVSMKYGLVIPICRKCHEIVTNDKTLQEKLHKVGQKAFEKQYKTENFVQVFREKLFIDTTEVRQNLIV